MGTLDSRLAKIEQRAGVVNQARARTIRDADACSAKILAMANGFSNEDVATDEATRAGWSQASRLAWALRFSREHASTLLADLRTQRA